MHLFILSLRGIVTMNQDNENFGGFTLIARGPQINFKKVFLMPTDKC